jgi:Predicted pyridoxal phosphate-dependent enzyme apparently involved in regulation of cell wall biogenesis
MSSRGPWGLAQVRKLDFMISEQKKNKAAIKAMLSSLKGIKFRELPDPEGDTATFLAFNLPDEGTAEKFQQVLSAGGVDTVCYKKNAWHYAMNWEHFLAQSTANSTKFPFTNPMNNRTVQYNRRDIPQADDLLGRTLVMGINIRMPEERLATIRQAIEKAADVL